MKKIKETEFDGGKWRIINKQTRYDLSFYSYRTLIKDHIRFCQQYCSMLPANFINHILLNYIKYEFDHDQDIFEKEISEAFHQKRRSDYFKEPRISLNKDVTEKIEECSFIDHPDFQKKVVLTYILERFTALSFAARERVYCYPQYKTIRDCIVQKNEMVVDLLKNASSKTITRYEVKPYRLEIDDNSFSYYLIGFAREYDSECEYEWHTFKLIRIQKCRKTRKEFVLPWRETRNTDDMLEKFGAAYLSGRITPKEIEQTVVRLTKKGYEEMYLKRVTRQRPIPISEPRCDEAEQCFELTFDCSHAQIRNYFFSFGAEAEIISPVSLRNQFKEELAAALNLYVQDSDKAE